MYGSAMDGGSHPLRSFYVHQIYYATHSLHCCCCCFFFFVLWVHKQRQPKPYLVCACKKLLLGFVILFGWAWITLNIVNAVRSHPTAAICTTLSMCMNFIKIYFSRIGWCVCVFFSPALVLFGWRAGIVSLLHSECFLSAACNLSLCLLCIRKWHIYSAQTLTGRKVNVTELLLLQLLYYMRNISHADWAMLFFCGSFFFEWRVNVSLMVTALAKIRFQTGKSGLQI